MDLAIQCAAIDIDKKATKNKNKRKSDIVVGTPDEVKAKLEESKSSPIIKSPGTHIAQDGRRIGVSEKDQLDRELVKQSLKNYLKVEKMTSMGSMME